MYINDKALNDDDFHNGSTIIEKDSSSYTDGRFVANQSNDTAKYVFSRTPNKDYFFSLTPEKESFYKFSGASYLQVTYEKGWFIFKNTMTVNPETDGTYLLSKGITYTIKMRTSSGEFSVQQDNWVYAPNGGKWTIAKISNPLGYKPIQDKIFISPKLLVEATCKTLPDSNNYEVYTCYTNEDIKNIMANITYTDPSAEADFKESATSIATLGGMLCVIVSFIPGVKEYTLLYYAAFYGGTATTSVGFISWISDEIQRIENARIMEVIQNGNLSIQCSHFIAATGNKWDVWSTPLYINKYQSGNRGTVNKNINADNVKIFCGW